MSLLQRRSNDLHTLPYIVIIVQGHKYILKHMRVYFLRKLEAFQNIAMGFESMHPPPKKKLIGTINLCILEWLLNIIMTQIFSERAIFCFHAIWRNCSQKC